MAAACLRVLADDADEDPSANLAGVIAKLTNAFVESRWTWPRRYGRVGRIAFLMADPRAEVFDAAELCSLAHQLEVKLFGTDTAVDVSLLLFEGSGEAISRFATCEAAALWAALDGEDDAPPLIGRVQRITAAGVEIVAHQGDPAAADQAAAAAALDATVEDLVQRLHRNEDAPAEAAAPESPTIGFHAVYHVPRRTVVGAAVSDGQLGASSLRGVFGNAGHIQGEQARRYDTRCLEGVLPALEGPFPGLAFLPLSFSELVRTPSREAYLPWLKRLPPSRRGQLAASVYDVPRDPSFNALKQLTAFLGEYFGFIDLCVTDPGFRIEKLSIAMVNSVTLVLTGTDAQTRLAAVRRFMENRETYIRQKIWPGVGHIRGKAEFDFCLTQGAPFLSGPAVSDLLDAPPEAGALEPGALPLRRETGEPAARYA
jgi:hypothetical protein